MYNLSLTYVFKEWMLWGVTEGFSQKTDENIQSYFYEMYVTQFSKPGKENYRDVHVQVLHTHIHTHAHTS